ncbi:MAG: four helix bundle protein [Pseudomonadota bacterium]
MLHDIQPQNVTVVAGELLQQVARLEWNEIREIGADYLPHFTALHPGYVLYDAQSQGGSTRQKHLRQADAALNKLRLYLRLAHQWHWLSDGQYRHVSVMVAELGRLLGGWIHAK